MKKLFAEVPNVPQGVANRATRIVEKHLRLAHVDRARDLSEEAKVRLLRDLRFLFDSESADGGHGARGSSERKNWLGRLLKRIESFLNLGETAMLLMAVLVTRAGWGT